MLGCRGGKCVNDQKDASEARRVRAGHVTIEDLWFLADRSMLDRTDWMTAVGSVRDTQAWRDWSIRIIYAIGVAHVLAGVVFFFAYNWADLAKAIKFGLLFGGIAISVTTWLFAGIDSRPGQISGVIATVLTGVLMAVFGQIYQTGADAYELFASWAILVLPWMLVSRNPAHVLVWIIIADTAFGLFGAQVMYPVWGVSDTMILVMNAAVIGAILAAQYWAVRSHDFLDRWWLQGTLVLGVTLHMMLAGWQAAANYNFSPGQSGTEWEFFLILAITGMILGVFWRLAGNKLGAIMSLAGLVSMVTLHGLLAVSRSETGTGAGLLIVMALIVMVASALFIYLSKWLAADISRRAAS